jgi:hypothetical protein
MDSPTTIKLQVLLREPWRTAEGVGRARALMAELGMTPTAEGRATISAEIGRDEFATLFQRSVEEIAPQAPSGRDFGRSGGHISGELPVPEPLREYVESITVASPYLRL